MATWDYEDDDDREQAAEADDARASREHVYATLDRLADAFLCGNAKTRADIRALSSSALEAA